MLLHYLVKVEASKMHVNTTSTFNSNYKVAVICIKFHWHFIKCSAESHEWAFMSEHVSKVSISPACTHDLKCPHCWSIAVSMICRSKSNQVCIKRFYGSLMSRIFVSYTNCCTTPRISKFKAHDDPGPLGWSYNHLMQFFGNIPL